MKNGRWGRPKFSTAATGDATARSYFPRRRLLLLDHCDRGPGPRAATNLCDSILREAGERDDHALGVGRCRSSYQEIPRCSSSTSASTPKMYVRSTSW
jgi:hypothetical protein